MPNSSNKSNTVIFVLNEIYGMNKHIQKVCKKFSEKGYDVVCPDLTMAKQTFDYDQEEEAYRHFMEGTGFESAAEKVEKLITKAKLQYEYVILAGYSIGATVAWICSSKNDICDGIIGFYGSRIRDYIELTPKCPALLFFPKEEKSFDVHNLSTSLKKADADIHILEGSHGFCDPFGAHYCEQSSKEAENLVNDFLKKIRQRHSVS